MDFLAAVRVMVRRWRVLIPCLILTGLITVVAFNRVEVSYSSSGTVLLFYPTQVADPETGVSNSYLAFGNLTVVANVISEVLSQDVAREQLQARGATAVYEVGTDSTSSTPLITVIANGQEAEAVRTVRIVMDSIGEELERRQVASGAPPATWITADAVTTPDTAEPQLGSRVRAGAAVAILGLAASVSLAFMAEALSERRHPRRREPAIAQPTTVRRARGGEVRTEPRGVPSWTGTTLKSWHRCTVCGMSVRGAENYHGHLLSEHDLVPASIGVSDRPMPVPTDVTTATGEARPTNLGRRLG